MILNLKKFRKPLGILLLLLVPLISISLIKFNERDNGSQPVSLTSNSESVDGYITVNKPETADRDKMSFFSEFRMERERVRAKQLELLKEIANNPSSDKKARDTALLKLVEVSETVEKEMQAETVIKSSGIRDCIVMIEKGRATIIIEGEALPPEKEGEIKKVAGIATGYNQENINIIVRSAAR